MVWYVLTLIYIKRSNGWPPTIQKQFNLASELELTCFENFVLLYILGVVIFFLPGTSVILNSIFTETTYNRNSQLFFYVMCAQASSVRRPSSLHWPLIDPVTRGSSVQVVSGARIPGVSLRHILLQGILPLQGILSKPGDETCVISCVVVLTSEPPGKLILLYSVSLL